MTCAGTPATTLFFGNIMIYEGVGPYNSVAFNPDIRRDLRFCLNQKFVLNGKAVLNQRAVNILRVTTGVRS